MSDLDEKLAKLKERAVSQLNDAGAKDLDHDLIDDLVGRMRLIVNNKDAMLVSGTDEKELETVRKNFVEKKLGVEDHGKGMAAISKVADQMSGIKMKNRVAFYYMVQKELGK